MSEKTDLKKISTLQDLLVAQMIQIDTLTLMLIEKGVFSQEAFFSKLCRPWKSRRNTRADNVEAVEARRCATAC